MPSVSIRSGGYVNQRRADLLLCVISLIWGTTFTIVHEVVGTFPAIALIALRFIFATLVFVPLLVRRRREVSTRGWLVGLMLGVVLFTGFATQTIGLQYTTPARAGFITGLNVLMVPLIGLVFGNWPSSRAMLGVGLALIGLMVLSTNCQLAASRSGLECALLSGALPQQRLGDLLILACALAFALHIVAVDRWAAQYPILPLNTVQLLVVAVLASGSTLIAVPSLPMPSLPVLLAALFLGLIATALVFALQLLLQRYTSATHTALIFALEPVFAAFFSWLWTREAITVSVLIGGGLMLAGVIVAEAPVRRRATRAEEAPIDQPESAGVSARS